MSEEETKQVEEREKTDEEILFPEVVRHGYTITPWSYGQLCVVSDDLETIINYVEENDFLDKISQFQIAKLFSKNKKALTNILCTTLDIKKEELEALQPFDKVFDIAMVIFSQNWDIIKNALSL